MRERPGEQHDRDGDGENQEHKGEHRDASPAHSVTHVFLRFGFDG
jgi:hypothetical protein